MQKQRRHLLRTTTRAYVALHTRNLQHHSLSLCLGDHQLGVKAEAVLKLSFCVGLEVP